jgi:hypothetical protein
VFISLGSSATKYTPNNSDDFDVESGNEDAEDWPWRPSHTIFGKSSIKQS